MPDAPAKVERAQQGSSAVPAASSARNDLALAALVLLLGGALFSRIDAFERITRWTSGREHVELDDLLLTLALGVLLSAWFSVRRWREATQYVARLEELSSALLETEARERHRLAELLHDELGQTLYACRLRLSVLAQRAQGGEPGIDIDESARELEALLGEALARTRELSVDLSPPELHDLGLFEALSGLAQRFSSRHGVRVDVESGPAWSQLAARAHAPVYHSVSELLLNAAKHAGATRVAVSASRLEHGIEVCVADDGRGFDPASHTSRRGFGLFSIERRMVCLAASLHVESSAERGTCARLRLPHACTPHARTPASAC